MSYTEPCYAQALDWLLCDGIHRLGALDGESLYLRLSTRSIDQRPFIAARDRIGEGSLRDQVLAGGYRLVEPDAVLAADPHAPRVVLAATGAVVPEAVHAAAALADEGVAATVLDLTSPDRVYRAWRGEMQQAGRSARSADLSTSPRSSGPTSAVPPSSPCTTPPATPSPGSARCSASG
jgi:pyruvate dehydrogenase E1 component